MAVPWVGQESVVEERREEIVCWSGSCPLFAVSKNVPESEGMTVCVVLCIGGEHVVSGCREVVPNMR